MDHGGNNVPTDPLPAYINWAHKGILEIQGFRTQENQKMYKPSNAFTH